MSSSGWKPPEERDPEILQIPGVGGRLLFMRVVVVLILSLLVYRVYALQQTKGADLATRAELNQFATLTTDAPRGVILDRHGEPRGQHPQRQFPWPGIGARRGQERLSFGIGPAIGDHRFLLLGLTAGL